MLRYSSPKVIKLLEIPTNPLPNVFYLVEDGSGNTLFFLSNSARELILLNDSVASGLADGTYGDITVSASGTTMTVNPATIRGAISLTTTGSSGAATYNTGTGVLNIPVYTGGGGGSLSIGSAVGSGTTGSVLFVDGSGNLAQDNSLYWDATNNSLYLYDKTYVDSPLSKAFLNVGSTTAFNPGNDFFNAVHVDLDIAAPNTQSGGLIAGVVSHINNSGSSSNVTTYAGAFVAQSLGETGGSSKLLGVYGAAYARSGTTTGTNIGGQFDSIPGGSQHFPTGIGAKINSWGGHNGNQDDVIGTWVHVGEFGGAGVGSIVNLTGIKSTVGVGTVSTTTAVTTVKGLEFSGWLGGANNGGLSTAVNSYVIYADASDANLQASGNKYFLYSLSTSPSLFSGTVSVPDDAYDATTWNGNLTVPTKNAIRDKIESLATGGMAIGGSITSATEGSVLFAGPSGVLAQDNPNFRWDDTNNMLMIGSAFPYYGNPATTRTFVYMYPDDNLFDFAYTTNKDINFFELGLFNNNTANNKTGRWFYGNNNYQGTGTGFKLKTFDISNVTDNVLVAENTGFKFLSSSGSGGTTLQQGIDVIVRSGFGGTVATQYAYKGSVQAVNTGSVLTSGAIFKGTVDDFGLSGETITTVKGLDLSEWSTTVNVVNSYGIYLDTSIDRGTSLKYAIYSLSTSPSVFTGSVTVPDVAYNASTWDGDFTVPTKNAVRDKIESLIAGGLSIGSAVTGGAANRVLYEDASQNLASDPDFTFDGSNLTVNGNINVNHTLTSTGDELNLQQTGDTLGSTRFRLMNRDGISGALLENVSVDLADLVFRTSTGDQGTLRLEGRSADVYNTANTLEFQLYNAVTDTYFFASGIGGTSLRSGPFGVGVDNPSAKLHVLATTEQLRLGYDASNYYKTTIGSTGSVAFDAVGSGAAFTFSDKVIVPDDAYSASTWDGNFEVPTKNAIRDKIEALSVGMTVGGAVTGGGANRVLYEDASQNLASNSKFLFNGSTLSVEAQNLAQTADIFKVNRYDSTTLLNVAHNGEVTIGPAYDFVNAKHTAQHTIRYAGTGVYSDSGLILQNVTSGSTTRLHSLSSGLYITKNDGTAAPLLLGEWQNPGDGNSFYATVGSWYIAGGNFGVGESSTGAKVHVKSTTEQLRLLYDASNYFKATVNSTGSVTFDLVGTTPKFTFADAVIVPDDAYDATTWNGNFEAPTKNAVRDKIESLTVGSGLAIGTAVTGGGANRVLYEDASQNLAADPDLTFDGSTLTVNGNINISHTLTTTADELNLQQTGDASGSSRFRLMNRDGIAGAVLQNVTNDLADLSFLTSTDAQANIRLEARSADIYNSGNSREFQLYDAIADNFFFATGAGGTSVRSGSFGVGTDNASAKVHIKSTTEQLRVGYDTSNYYKATVNSTGGVTWNAVGSGAKFVFNNNDVYLDNPTAATSGTPYQASPYLYMGGQAWTGSATADAKIRIRAVPHDTAGTYKAVKLAVDFLIVTGSYQTSLTYGAKDSDYLTTVMQFRSPVTSAWGGDLEATYDGNFSFRNTSGDLSGLRPGYISWTGGSGTGYQSLRSNSTGYGTTVQTAFGSPFIFKQTESGYGGDYQVFMEPALGVGQVYSVNSIDAKLHVLSTTEQLRLGYDASNYVKATVSSTGGVTFDAVGSGAGFTFSDAVSVPDLAYDATTWNGNLTVPTKNAVRDKFESFGAIVGNAVTGGGANRVLFEDGSQNIATNSGFTFDGTTFTVANLKITPFATNSTWIEFPTSASGGVGVGAAGANPFFAYAGGTGHWFTNANAGDFAYRNISGNILIGTTTDYSGFIISDDLLYNRFGNSTGYATVGGKLAQFLSDGASVAAGSDLYTKSIPANSLRADGYELEFTYSGTFAANGNSKNLIVKFAGTNLISDTVTTSGGSWNIKGNIIRDGSASVKATVVLSTSAGYVNTTYVRITSLTFSNAYDLILAGTSTANADFTAKLGTVSYVPMSQ